MSKVVLVISRMAFASSVLASLPWVLIVFSHNGWGALFYWAFVTPWVGGTALLLGTVPSGILYAQRHQPRDLASLKWSSAAVLIVAVESLLLFAVPLHGS